MGPSTRLIDGKYRLGVQVGEGGMGAVYEAEHIGLRSKVAIKLLGEHALRSAKRVERFRREARAAASIHHDHIVQVTDTGTDHSLGPYLVMELLKGESLAGVLTREGRLRPVVAAELCAQVLDGLEAAHVRGIVHRDLKPGNVFLVSLPNGRTRAKVLDFGISKLMTDVKGVTAEGAIVGTPHYLAPEQIRGGGVDGRTDIYATGVMLYRMITGHLPYFAEETTQLYDAILKAQATPAEHSAPNVPGELGRVIKKAMSPSPPDRYQTAGEMSEALRNVFSPEQAADDAPTMPPVEGASGGTPRVSQRPLAPAPSDDTTDEAWVTSGGSDRAGDDLPSNTIPSGDPTGETVRPIGRAVPPKAWAAEPGFSPRRRSRRWMMLAALGGSVAGIALVGVAWYAGGGTPGRWRGSAASRESTADGSPQAKPGEGAAPPIRLGLIRFLPAAMVERRMRPVAHYLGQALGRPVAIKVVEDYRDLDRQLLDRNVDVAALNAYAYVKAVARSKKIRLLATAVNRGGSHSYEGLILTRVDAGIDTLEDLSGRLFCYVNPNSTSGYLFPRALLRQRGIDPDVAFRATRFGGDHLATLRALYGGACDAAAVYASLYTQADQHGMSPQAFRVLASTERIPYDAYCAGPSLDEQSVNALRRALLALAPGSDEAAGVLVHTGDLRGFLPAEDSDYDTVREMVRFLAPDGL